jgi:ParB-like chromosome segregation protein Spo0J
MSDRGYALDMSSVVSHVATAMEGAGPDGPAPTVESMAATYRHVITGDLARVRLHEGVGSDHDAVLWLIGEAVRELNAYVIADGDGYRLRTPLDKIRWNGRQVPRVGRDEHARLGDPFNPMAGGVFAANVRIGKAHKANPPEDDILRESMRENGWLDGHPAVVDERGAVVTGHRRLRIAQELGIEPRLERIIFGSGDEGDIARLKLAWWSNEGGKPYTPSDRQAVAAYLRERGWTQASIAEALHVVQQTISDDLRKAEQQNLITGSGNQNVQNGTVGPGSGSGGRRRGAGRPRKNPRPPTVAPEVEDRITERVAEGASVPEIAKEFGVGTMPAREAWQRARGRLEERQSGRPATQEPTQASQSVLRRAPLPREQALEEILRVLLQVSPEDRAWLLNQIPAQIS